MDIYDELIASLNADRRAREDAERHAAGEPTEAEYFATTERPVSPRELDRMYDEDALYDRACEDREFDDRIDEVA